MYCFLISAKLGIPFTGEKPKTQRGLVLQQTLLATKFVYVVSASFRAF